MKHAICLVLLLCVSAGLTDALLNDNCMIACPRNLDPVCGTNHVTYANACTMERMLCLEGKKATVHIAHQGAC